MRRPKDTRLSPLDSAGCGVSLGRRRLAAHFVINAGEGETHLLHNSNHGYPQIQSIFLQKKKRKRKAIQRGQQLDGVTDGMKGMCAGSRAHRACRPTMSFSTTTLNKDLTETRPSPRRWRITYYACWLPHHQPQLTQLPKQRRRKGCTADVTLFLIILLLIINFF